MSLSLCRKGIRQDGSDVDAPVQRGRPLQQGGVQRWSGGSAGAKEGVHWRRE